MGERIKTCGNCIHLEIDGENEVAICRQYVTIPHPWGSRFQARRIQVLPEEMHQPEHWCRAHEFQKESGRRET